MQREGEVIHLICARLFDLAPILAGLGERESKADSTGRSVAPSLRLKSRNFH